MNFKARYIILVAILLVRCEGCLPGHDMTGTSWAQGTGIGMLSDSVRDWAISFVLIHEGGHVVYNGVDYNYGLSGTYHGDVKRITKDSARHVYQRLWLESNAARMGDSCMALVFFDTYIMFNPAVARELLEGCYEPRSYLLRRLEKHCRMIQKYPDKKQFLFTWNRRIVDLFSLCQ